MARFSSPRLCLDSPHLQSMPLCSTGRTFQADQKDDTFEMIIHILIGSRFVGPFVGNDTTYIRGFIIYLFFNNYNIRIKTIPDVIIARIMDLSAQEMFQVPEEKKRT